MVRCPKCGARLKPDAERCIKCGLPLIQTDRQRPRALTPMPIVVLKGFCLFLGFFVTLALFGYAGLRLHYWNQDRVMRRDYRGHTIETITTDKGTPGHAILFYGADGNTVYIEELSESFMFIGNVARVEFEDSRWFDEDPTDTESAKITLTPVVITPGGERSRLPTFTMTVQVPESPVRITAPASLRANVITSVTPLTMYVVYGSEVIINGENVTDLVDRSGMLSVNINVYPVGENNVSVIVRTANHKEARRDIVFYRDVMEINLELSTSVGFTSTLNYMTVTGVTDPGAWIEVDTPYDADSLIVDQSTGKFSFKAKFSTYGDNLVKFRAVKTGLKDSTISFAVNYLPAMAEYSRHAWRMDYKQLRTLYEQWNGRIFLCEGTIVAGFLVDEVQYAVMDVSKTAEAQWIVLQNQSNTGTMNVGAKYSVYADVSGRYFYNAAYYPMLTARYVELMNETK